MLKYRSLTKEILDRSVDGVSLKSGTLRNQLHPSKPVLMVFLRHLGCQFCKETVRDIRNAQNLDPEYPNVLFFFQESVEAGQAFFNQFWPRAKGISDPDLFFYTEFGIPAGGLLEVAGPRALLAGLRATAKGNLQSWPKGNVWQMPGFFIVSGDKIFWSHQCQHAGDRPPIKRMTYFVHSIKLNHSGHAGNQSEASGKTTRIKPAVRVG
jgi:hypothetical protein